MFDVVYSDLDNKKIDCLLDVNFIPRIGELVIFTHNRSKYYQVITVIYPLFDNNHNKQTVIVKCKETY